MSLALFDRFVFDPNVFDTSALQGAKRKTVGSFLIATLKLIGVVAKMEVPSPDEMQDALDRFQSMIDTWSADRLTIFTVTPTIFPLVSGQQSYSIGLGGANFNVPRPLFIQNAGIISNNNPLQPLELPVRILDDDEWASLSIKNVQSTLSWYLWYDYAWQGPKGWGNIKLWPIPSVGVDQLVLYLPTPMSNFVGIQDQLIVPPGWEEALRFNLAMRLWPEFGKGAMDPIIASGAAQGYAMICRANKRFSILEIDEALMSNAQGLFNYLTGDSGNRR